MKSKDESIQMLKMRIQNHMNISSENVIRPENMQYYVSSMMMQKEGEGKDIRADEDKAIYRTVYEKLQNGEKLSDKENENMQQKDNISYQKAKAIERENEEYWKKLRDCRTKEDVQRLEDEYRRLKSLGLSMTENDAEVPMERKQEHTLFKDAKVSAINNITRQFIESEDYKKLPTDAQYIQKFGENTPMLKDIKVPEQIEVQHERAKNGYEKVLHSEEDLFGYKEMHWLNIKG